MGKGKFNKSMDSAGQIQDYPSKSQVRRAPISQLVCWREKLRTPNSDAEMKVFDMIVEKLAKSKND